MNGSQRARRIWQQPPVPDYMAALRDGGFYGWPYGYFGANVDERVKPLRPDLVALTVTLRTRAEHLGRSY